MKRLVLIAVAVIATALGHAATALAQTNRPNILVNSEADKLEREPDQDQCAAKRSDAD